MCFLTFPVEPLNSKLNLFFLVQLNSKLKAFFHALCQCHSDDNWGGISILRKGNIYYLIFRKHYFIALDSCHYFGINARKRNKQGVLESLRELRSSQFVFQRKCQVLGNLRYLKETFTYWMLSILGSSNEDSPKFISHLYYHSQHSLQPSRGKYCAIQKKNVITTSRLYHHCSATFENRAQNYSNSWPSSNAQSMLPSQFY